MKLKAAAKTKLYELTYLVAGTLTDSEAKKVQETVQGLVKKHKGTIKSEDSWGKKPLAYAIRKGGTDHREASYLHLVVEFDASHVGDFEKDVYLTEEVIRHLLVEAETTEAAEEVGEQEVKEETKEQSEK